MAAIAVGCAPVAVEAYAADHRGLPPSGIGDGGCTYRVGAVRDASTPHDPPPGRQHLALLALALAGCAGDPAGPHLDHDPALARRRRATPSTASASPTTTGRRRRLRATTFDALTPDQRAGQLLMVGLEPTAARARSTPLVRRAPRRRHLPRRLGRRRRCRAPIASTSSPGPAGGAPAASGCSSPPTRRAARCSSCAGPGFTPMPSAAQPGAVRRQPREADATRLVARARRRPASTSTSRRSPTPCPPRSAAANAARSAATGREFAPRPRGPRQRMPRPSSAGSLAGGVAPTRQALPGPRAAITGNTDVTAERHHRPHDDRRRPLPRSRSRAGDQGRAPARHGVARRSYPQARPRQPGDVLRRRRHRPAARASSASTASSSPTTSAPPRPWPPSRRRAGDPVHRGRRRHRPHRRGAASRRRCSQAIAAKRAASPAFARAGRRGRHAGARPQGRARASSRCWPTAQPRRGDRSGLDQR